MNKRHDLENDATLAATSGLGVTIQGRYQDEAMLDAVRRSVVNEFNRRIAEVDEELRSLGVEV
ncbi:hypothetical protein [Microvirga mediterraneensis]|uniref:Uncharacterized protein n=1 Tax=Microvirga mediterraneensis TaxID=2754695 RepID=A0A838BQV7_9HYPH|nr:hypothetical protein [Microvirga mediterraneensis]MBA1157771.1 hypothetical protein [Microvirga mediterraneensis]